MKKNIFTSFLILSALQTAPVFAEEAEAPKTRIGPGKAVTEAMMENGIKLSEKAVRNLELRLIPMRQNGTIIIPTKALVKFQDFYAIYRKRDGWFKMIEVDPHISNGNSTVSSKDLKSGDEVVIENADLLRVVDLDVWGPEADACVD